MSRRTIQSIAGLPAHAGHGPKVLALCNDGTLWSFGHGEPWARCTPVPQDAAERDPVPPLYCAQCVHLAPANGAAGPRCRRPRDAVHDLVTGAALDPIVTCAEERQDVPGRCGRDAQYFLLDTKKVKA